MIVADSCYSGSLTRDNRGIVVHRKILDDNGYIAKMAKIKSRVVLSSSGVIDSASLYPQIKRMVMMNASQTPEYGDIRFTGSEGGDFLFVRKN